MSYISKLEEKIGKPDLLVCLDSGCKDYERLWITTSLRGNIVKNITVKCLKDSVHSGLGTGLVPDSFTVIRSILDRIEDSKTSTVVKDFHVEIPKEKFQEAKDVISILGESYVLAKTLEGVKYLNQDLEEVYLNNTWRPTLCVIGMSGLPEHTKAGNVLRDSTSIRISLRIPPTLNGVKASERLNELITKDPPYNSIVEVESRNPGNGWSTSKFSERIQKSLEESSVSLWGKKSQTVGEGGSIPFINSLSEKFPESDFLVMGVLGPGSNAHAANETLNIPYCKKVTTSLAYAILDLFN